MLPHDQGRYLTIFFWAELCAWIWTAYVSFMAQPCHSGSEHAALLPLPSTIENADRGIEKAIPGVFESAIEPGESEPAKNTFNGT